MKNKTKFILIILTALILNIIWEFSHYQLYIDLSNIAGPPHLIIASITDVVYIAGFYLIISIKNKSIKWINYPSKIDYTSLIILGLVTAITIEVINLNLGRWEYKSTMPTLLRIGLSPLIQLFTTAILSLQIIKIIKD